VGAPLIHVIFKRLTRLKALDPAFIHHPCQQVAGQRNFTGDDFVVRSNGLRCSECCVGEAVGQGTG
jgi:hypothetical protein